MFVVGVGIRNYVHLLFKHFAHHCMIHHILLGGFDDMMIS